MPECAGVGTPGSGDAAARTQALGTVAAAVQSTTAVRGLVAGLAAVGVPVMVLRGPQVQQRLLGTDSAYRSADVDLLVPRRRRRQAFLLLEAGGWRFSPENGVLWRLDRAAAFSRAGVTVDLHWGLHAHSISGRHLQSLERALWLDARPTADGWYEPRAEPLLVYLAVHGTASGFHKRESLLLIDAARRLVDDWPEVDRVAAEAHVASSVRHALAVAEGRTADPPPPVFDGRVRRLVSAVARWLRATSALPALRRAVAAVRRRRRSM